MANNVTLEIDVKTQKALRNLDSFGKKFKDNIQTAALSITGLNQGFELLGKGIDFVGDAFDKIGKPALEFQDSIAEITTLLDDTSVSTQQLGDTVLDLQKQFGGNSTVKAKAFYNALSSGAVGAADAAGFLEKANKLAVGGITDLNTAVDGLTTVISAFGLSADETTNINDALFIAMKRGKTTIGELSSGIGAAAANAANLGVSYQELLSATSALTTGGISTSVAFTQLRATMVGLSKPTAGLQEILDNLGITSIKAKISQDGLVGTLKEIIGQTDGSAEALSQLFGSVEAVGAVSAITSETIGSTFTAALGDMGVAAQNAGDTTEAAFEKISSTTSFKIKRLQGVVDAGFTNIGDIILDRLGFAVDATSNRLDAAFTAIGEGLRVFFNEIDDAGANLDFGDVVDAAFKLAIRGVQGFVDITIKGIKAIGEFVKAFSTFNSLESPLDAFDDALLGILIQFKEWERAIISVDKRLNDFWGQNAEQSQNQQDSIDAITENINQLYLQVAEPIELDLETQEIQDNIDKMIESLEETAEAAEKGFDKIVETYDDKTVTVGVKPVFDVEPGDAFVGPEQPFEMRVKLRPDDEFAGPQQELGFFGNLREDFSIFGDELADSLGDPKIGEQIGKGLVAQLSGVSKAGNAALAVDDLQAQFDKQEKLLKIEENNLAQARADFLSSSGTYQKEVAKINYEEAQKAYDREREAQDKLSKDLDKAQQNRDKASQDAAAGFLKVGAVGVATAIAGPVAGEIAGPLFDFLMAGPEAIREGIDAMVDALPVVVETLAEAAPVFIEALAENVDEIVIALARPDLWFQVALAFGEALYVTVPMELAKAIPGVFIGAGQAFREGVNAAVLDWRTAVDQSSEYLENKFYAISDGFDRFAQHFDPIIDFFERIGAFFANLQLPSLGGGIGGGNGFDPSQLLGNLTPFATGGTVPEGYPNDTFAARLSSGENVISRDTNEKLSQFLDGQGQATASLVGQVVSAITGGAGQPVQVNLQLDQETLASAIFDLNQRNARLA